MNAPIRATTAVLAIALATATTACSHHDSSSTERPRDPSQVCVITDVPRDAMTDGGTFADLLDRPATGDDVIGTAAAIVLLRSRYDADLGPYEPVIDHFVAIYREVDQRKHRPPKVTSEVRRSAKRLDRDVADGLCG